MPQLNETIRLTMNYLHKRRMGRDRWFPDDLFLDEYYHVLEIGQPLNLQVEVYDSQARATPNDFILFGIVSLLSIRQY